MRANGCGSAGCWRRSRNMKKGKSDNLRFARRLETVCGPKAKGAFRSFHGHVDLWPGPAGKPPVDFSTVECLISAAAVSGMPFGFVGNEYTGTR